MEIPTINLFVPDGPGGSPHNTIQSAVDAAFVAPGGAVWIPANYIGTDTYTNPDSVPIFDMRGTGAISFGGGAAGGSDGQIQFNDSGSFGGDAELTWDNTAKSLTVNADGNVTINSNNDAVAIFSKEELDISSDNDIVFTSNLADVDIQAGATTFIHVNQSGIISLDSSAGSPSVFLMPSAGSVNIARDIGSVGFYGATPIIKPTVTGSRGGNAAVASLLTAFANMGLIVDNSS